LNPPQNPVKKTLYLTYKLNKLNNTQLIPDPNPNPNPNPRAI